MAGAENDHVRSAAERAWSLTDELEALQAASSITSGRVSKKPTRRSGVGNLVRPTDLYLRPRTGGRNWPACRERTFEHLEVERADEFRGRDLIPFPTYATFPWLGSAPCWRK